MLLQAQARGDPALSELRFRSNSSIEGTDAWAEQSWLGRKLTIGELEFEAVRPKVRCLATDANPVTGVHDVPVMKTLKSAFKQAQSTFAIALVTSGPGGTLRVGDAVTLRD